MLLETVRGDEAMPGAHLCRRGAGLLLLLFFLLVLDVVLLATADNSANTSAALNWRLQHLQATQSRAYVPTSKKHRSANKRQLLEGLGCDLDVYQSFAASEEAQDMFVMATMCESRIVYLKHVRAGDYGPVDQADMRSAMCSDECLRSDELHQLALSRSRCTCAQVSATTFVTSDFCLESSARLLCTHLSECGHWNCDLEDFMCLRYEWDKLYPCSSRALLVSPVLAALCYLAVYLLA